MDIDHLTSPTDATGIKEQADLYDPRWIAEVLDSGETRVPHVLISLSLEEDQLLDFEQCRR